MVFQIDVEMNKKLKDLIDSTKSEHDVWIVRNGVPFEPSTLPQKLLGGFVPTDQYLPVMFESDDLFNSSSYLLLVQSESGMLITEGYLMKWTDGTEFFWYNHDVIENVIGFMQLPKIQMASKHKLKKIGQW